MFKRAHGGVIMNTSNIVSIFHVFSCRLYGLRKYKKQIEGDEEIAKELQDGNKPVTGTEGQD